MIYTTSNRFFDPARERDQDKQELYRNHIYSQFTENY